MYVTIRSWMRLIMDSIGSELSELFPLEFAEIAESDFVYTIASRVPRCSVVKCLTRNPEVLGLSLTGSCEFFLWECPWARHFRA